MKTTSARKRETQEEADARAKVRDWVIQTQHEQSAPSQQPGSGEGLRAPPSGPSSLGRVFAAEGLERSNSSGSYERPERSGRTSSGAAGKFERTVSGPLLRSRSELDRSPHGSPIGRNRHSNRHSNGGDKARPAMNDVQAAAMRAAHTAAAAAAHAADAAATASNTARNRHSDGAGNATYREFIEKNRQKDSTDATLGLFAGNLVPELGQVLFHENPSGNDVPPLPPRPNGEGFAPWDIFSRVFSDPGSVNNNERGQSGSPLSTGASLKQPGSGFSAVTTRVDLDNSPRAGVYSDHLDKAVFGISEAREMSKRNTSMEGNLFLF